MDDNTRALYGHARSMPGSDKSALDQYEQTFEKSSEQRRIAYQAEWDNFLATIFVAAGAVLPGVRSAEDAATLIFKTLRGETDTKLHDAVQATNTRLTSLEATVESLRESARAAEQTGDRVEQLVSQVTSLEGPKLAAWRAEIIQQATNAGLLSNEQLKSQLKDEVTRAARELNLSQEDLSQLQTYLDGGDLKGLVGAGGLAGVVALIALIRTLGKSRGQSQIDELYDRLTNVMITTAGERRPTQTSAGSLPESPQK